MPSPLARRIVFFPIRVALVYGLLLLLWIPIGEGYARAYAATAEALLGSARPDRSARIAWAPPPESGGVEHWGRDLGVHLSFRGGLRRATRLEESFSRSTRYTGYVPVALLISLVLATPVSWRRRGLALVLGAVLVEAFSLAMLGVMIREWFYQAENQMLFRIYPELYPAWSRYLHSLWEISTWMMPYFAAPTVIWLLVTLRPGDLSGLLARPAAAAPRLPDPTEHSSA